MDKLCGMDDNALLYLLATLVLPPSILDLFDVTGMDVRPD